MKLMMLLVWQQMSTSIYVSSQRASHGASYDSYYYSSHDDSHKDSHEASHAAFHYEDFKYGMKERQDKMQYM